MINRKAAAAFLLVGGSMLSAYAHPAFAAGANGATDGDAVIGSLSASAVPSAQLAKMRAGSGTVASVNLGSDTNNSVSNSVTGSISNVQSINGNTGLTSVMQNTGNNALLQSSMTVNITLY